MEKTLFSGRRILVTGGAGFIGSNLTDNLLAHGAEVTVLDNFSTGKRENLTAAARYPGFRLLAGDIRDRAMCAEALCGADMVVHLAALGSVPRSVKDPCTVTEVNVGGFVNMLFCASQAGVKRFVYASSSSVYGDSAELPKREERTGKALSPYALTKAVDELFAENFHRVYGIDTVGLRFFNVFGRRQDPDGAYAAVIPKFASALLKHQSPQINGDGSFSRDFTSVENVLQIIRKALLAENRQALNQVYNVACGERVSLNELFAMLKEALSVFDPETAGVFPVYGEPRAGDIPHSLADIDKAVKLLDYHPEVNAAAGIRMAAQWYFENMRQ